MRITMIYYSRSGNTAAVAEKLANDLPLYAVRLQAKRRYGSYFTSFMRVVIEMMTKTYPAVTNEVPDLSDCEVLIVGAPVWGHGMPRLLQGFLKKCDTAGKIIVPFATSDNSEMNGMIDELKEICPNAEIKYPYWVNKASSDDYNVWLENIKSI